MSGPIHKQSISSEFFTLPGHAIHVAEQYGVPFVWYQADGLVRDYISVMTGDEPPDGGRHVGTVLTEGGTLVIHVYEALS